MDNYYLKLARDAADKALVELHNAEAYLYQAGFSRDNRNIIKPITRRILTLIDRLLSWIEAE